MINFPEKKITFKTTTIFYLCTANLNIKETVPQHKYKNEDVH